MVTETAPSQCSSSADWWHRYAHNSVNLSHQRRRIEGLQGDYLVTPSRVSRHCSRDSWHYYQWCTCLLKTQDLISPQIQYDLFYKIHLREERQKSKSLAQTIMTSRLANKPLKRVQKRLGYMPSMAIKVDDYETGWRPQDCGWGNTTRRWIREQAHLIIWAGSHNNETLAFSRISWSCNSKTVQIAKQTKCVWKCNAHQLNLIMQAGNITHPPA